MLVTATSESHSDNSDVVSTKRMSIMLEAEADAISNNPTCRSRSTASGALSEEQRTNCVDIVREDRCTRQDEYIVLESKKKSAVNTNGRSDKKNDKKSSSPPRSHHRSPGSWKKNKTLNSMTSERGVNSPTLQAKSLPPPGDRVIGTEKSSNMTMNTLPQQKTASITRSCSMESAPEETEGTEKLAQTRIVFVLGGPGCGKWTLCDLLAQQYSFKHLSVPNLLVDELKLDTSRGKEIASHFSEEERHRFVNGARELSEIVPSHLINELIKTSVFNGLEDTRGFIIDGFPRDCAQAYFFEREVAKVEYIVHIDVKVETMVVRLKAAEVERGGGESVEHINERLRFFLSNTLPVMQIYSRRDITRILNAEGSKEAVFENFCNLFEKMDAIYETKHLRCGIPRRKSILKQPNNDNNEKKIRSNSVVRFDSSENIRREYVVDKLEYEKSDASHSCKCTIL